MVRLTLFLTFVAGFADASTFVAADKLFSAHVTGNFIVFAYDLLQGADRSAWIKLLTFPVFVGAIGFAAWYHREDRPVRLLRLEGILLLMAAGLSLIVRPAFPAAMLVVAAMAVENAFNRLYPSLTWSVTTVMTGNVTTGTMHFVQGLFGRPREAVKLLNARRIFIMALVFLFGCIGGGFLAGRFGLVVLALPGAIVLLLVPKKA